MYRSLLLGVVGAVLGSFVPAAGAVHLSQDNLGQVVIFPYAVAQHRPNTQTLIEFRNTDPERHLIVSIQVKHLGGRPLLSGNVVISPHGSFAGALIDRGPSVSLTGARVGQCATAELSSTENPLSFQFIDQPVSISATERFVVEGYALGYLPAELASDCEAFRARYQPGGPWAPRNSDAFRNADVSAPDDTLTGWATIIDTEQVTALHLRPIVLADFTSEAMNIAPAVATRPSLLDVNPAVSTRPLSQRPSAGVAMSNWADPIHAIDALFMSTEIESNFALGGSLGASSNVVAYYPTRAYHRDRAFWGGRLEAPFNAASDDLEPRAFNRAGEALPAFPGIDGCGRNSASQLEITGLLFVALTSGCDTGEAYVRVDGNIGTLLLLQQGTDIVSLEGHRYSGLPVSGHTLTTLRTRFENGVPLARALSYAWARPMPGKSAIEID